MEIRSENSPQKNLRLHISNDRNYSIKILKENNKKKVITTSTNAILLIGAFK